MGGTIGHKLSIADVLVHRSSPCSLPLTVKHHSLLPSRSTCYVLHRNGSRSPNPNILQRSTSSSSRRAPTRVTSPPPQPPQSPTPSHASTVTTPRQSDFGFPPPHHHQQPLSPIPRRASASARLMAGFMTPGHSPNNQFAALPEEGHEASESAGGVATMRASSSLEGSTRTYSGARGLGVSSHPSSPSLPTGRRPNPSKRSHTASAGMTTRSISRTLPQEPRSLHVPGDSKHALTAEVCLRGLLDKSGGPCPTSSGACKMAIDLDSLDLEEEMRRAQETLEEDMVRWANGEGDVPRLLALQEAINAARPGSSMSANSGGGGQGRRPSQASSVHPRHREGSVGPRREDLADKGEDEQEADDHVALSTSPRANGFTHLVADRRPALSTSTTKKRTHSTSSSPSVRSLSSGLAPLATSPRSVSQQKLPSPMYVLSDLPSTPSSGPSSASTGSSGPLPSHSHSNHRSPSSARPARSSTMPIPAGPSSPALPHSSSPLAPSSLSSIMSSSSSSLHSPDTATARRASARSTTSSRPSFSSITTRAVSQPLVPTRARLRSEGKDFDLEQSYRMCNQQEGYVSFADVGVGNPFGDEDEEEEEERKEEEGKKGGGGSWWGWLAGGESSGVPAASAAKS